MEKKKKLTYRTKYKLYTLIGLIVTLLPLIIVMAINYDNYFTHYNGWKLYIGGFMGLGFALIVILRKLKLKRIIWLVVVFGLCFFFQSVLKDATMLSGMLLLGSGVDALFFEPKAKRYEKLADYKDQANIQGEVNKELVQSIVNAIDRGRV